MDESFDLQPIVRALAAYLLGHPLACDTADGIRRWWLDMEREVTMDEMHAVLDRMAGRGLLEAVPGPDGRKRFRSRASRAQLAAVANGTVDD